MIEATSVTIDGKTRLGTLRVKEPDLKWHGVGVHIVSKRLITTSDIGGRLKALGLKQVHYAPEYHSFFYTQTYPAMVATVVEFLAVHYWKIIWWLYAHARLFQELPISVDFLWRYFTPFYLCLKVVKWLKH